MTTAVLCAPTQARPFRLHEIARQCQPRWAADRLSRRVEVLRRSALLLASDGRALAQGLAEASRRPLAEVWSAEIVPTVDALRWLAREAPRSLRSSSLRRSWLQWYFRSTRHQLRWEPWGVVGIVSPGNAPLFLGLTQVTAALVAGNAVLWKPAPSATLTAFWSLSLLSRAGLPPGLLQVCPGGPGEARHLVQGGLDKLFFTGGSVAGLELYRQQAARGRPAVLELSGHHIALVLRDGDIGLAARAIAWAKLANGGRNCISVQTVLVERSVYESFLDRLRLALTELTPSASPTQPAPSESCRWHALVQDAVTQGARRLPPGVEDRTADGAIPVLLADVRSGMRVVDEEVQGPILGVASVDSADAAVAWVNARDHRLSASLWSSNVTRARTLARRLRVGQVWINEELTPAGQPEVTLAGRGASGFGSSRGAPGLMEMVQPQVISETELRSVRRYHTVAPAGLAALFESTTHLAVARGIGARVHGAASLAHALIRIARNHRGMP